MAETTLEVRLIRHGEKYPSNHPDLQLANKLTTEGGEKARLLGASLAEYDLLVVVSSEEDRAIMTGAEVRRGYNSIPMSFFQIEQGLTQYCSDEMRRNVKSGRVGRADAMEQCYRMVRPDAEGNTEVTAVRSAAERYLSVAMQYVQAQGLPAEVQSAVTNAKKPIVVLVGHDPQVGGVEQLLEPTVDLKEVSPLDGIRLVRQRQSVTYSFQNNGVQYAGIVLDK